MEEQQSLQSITTEATVLQYCIKLWHGAFPSVEGSRVVLYVPGLQHAPCLSVEVHIYDWSFGQVHLVVAGEGLRQKQLVGFHSYALAKSVTHTLEVALRWMTSMPSHAGTCKLVYFGHKVVRDHCVILCSCLVLPSQFILLSRLNYSSSCKASS